jgi:acetoacetyl-CoA synthetase
MTAGDPIWTPSAEFADGSRLADYQRHLECAGLRFEDYRALWRWSTTELSEFWESITDFFDLDVTPPESVLDESRGMPHVRWFAGSTTNFAATALAEGREGTAVSSLTEDGVRSDMSWEELRHAVGAVAHWLREQGVGVGDRVVAYVPNVPEAVVCLLATAAVGAVWASCAQEYAVAGALDRFAPLEPRVLIVADGYRYGGRRHDRRTQSAELAQGLGTLQQVLWIDNLGLEPAGAGARYADVVAIGRAPEFTRVPFEHPLWVLFSSGTTGRPKGIVQSHGGILLEHTKFLAFHADLRPGAVFLWLATPSWMVWNLQVSGLLVGATIATFDGNPVWPDASALWRIAEALDLDFLGASAAGLTAARRAAARPLDVAPGLRLRAIGSTGSPLPPDTARWVQAELPSVWLASASGGTDICSAFAGGIPTEPVHADRIQGPTLGVALEAWDDEGRPVVGRTGEMVVVRPLPSMPIGLWGDDDFSRYTAAYFDHYPGVWRHGDWMTVTEDGGIVVHGRSDAVMNRHGVRIGSSEIYAALDRLDTVADSLVVGVELADGDYWMPLFVVPADQAGTPVAEAFAVTVKAAIRAEASPRHVPDEVILVEALPRTRTGKRLEVPVKRILQGADPGTVTDAASVDDPSALAAFARWRPAGARALGGAPI